MAYRFYSLLVVSLGLVAAHAFASDDIVGGTLVSSSDPVAKSTVMLTDGNALCSASIIDQDLLVTAAHCVAEEDKGQTLYVIFALDMNKATKANVQPVVGFKYNSKYKGEAAASKPNAKDTGDIAIVRFSGGLPQGYAPAKLLSSQALNNGENVLLAGFGITEANTQDGVGQLRKVVVPIKNAKWGKTEVEVDQTEGKGSCNGDSGGPAFVQNGSDLLLWGVTSRGDENCTQTGIYTEIPAYTSWISQQAAILRQQ